MSKDEEKYLRQKTEYFRNYRPRTDDKPRVLFCDDIDSFEVRPSEQPKVLRRDLHITEVLAKNAAGRVVAIFRMISTKPLKE